MQGIDHIDVRIVYADIEAQMRAAAGPSAANLVLGLAPLGGTRKRMLLSVFAAYARVNGSGSVSDSRLRNASELGRDSFFQTMRELEIEGWVKRNGERFILAIEKMKANQRYLVGLSNINPGAAGTPNRFKRGNL